jgi:hypothetical protein
MKAFVKIMLKTKPAETLFPPAEQHLVFVVILALPYLTLLRTVQLYKRHIFSIIA